MLLACVLLSPSRASKLCQPLLSTLLLPKLLLVWKGAAFAMLSVELTATFCAGIATSELALVLVGHA
jgi:hypothetical protein